MAVFLGVFARQWWLWRQVYRGDDSVAPQLITPASMGIMLVFGLASLVLGIVNVGFPHVGLAGGRLFPVENMAIAPAIVMAAGWGVYHMALEGLAFFLSMHGCGTQTFHRVLCYACLTGLTIGTLQVRPQRPCLPSGMGMVAGLVGWCFSEFFYTIFKSASFTSAHNVFLAAGGGQSGFTASRVRGGRLCYPGSCGGFFSFLFFFFSS
jgi:hypothetical protein